jgi:tetratricopeptide (TPR) repeat protein
MMPQTHAPPNRVKELFQAALDLPATERAAFLERASGGDVLLREEVEALLAQDEAAEREQFLAGPGLPPTRPWPGAPSRWLGRQLGPYQLQAMIAEGGMGAVFLAQRTRDYRQRVAVKLVKSGLTSGEFRHRFEAERQALADLHHPHIARLLDGGVSEDGVPFLVMEYVEGVALDRFCDTRQLDLRCRLEVFTLVCDAIQHAHEQGIVHRDLKPGNILMTADGTPRVVDFGLAKQFRSGLAGDPPESPTHSGAVLGTPGYLAPEQAEPGRPIGPAADVYALGAVLYHLLTGRPPFRGDTPLQTLLQVRHADPVSPRRLHPGLPRDVETICLKCLEKEPRKRYAGARDLAADLRRWLRGEPVHARSVGPAGRLARWCRRQPVLAGLTIALASSLLIGSVIAVVLWRRAEANLAEARAQRQRAEDDFRAAFATIQELARLSHHPLLDQPLMDPLRKELTEEAVRYWQEFVRQHGHDPTLKRELARALLEVGRLSGKQRAGANTAAALHQALPLLEELHRDFPSDAEVQRLLAEAHFALAGAAFLSAGVDNRLGHLQQAQSLLEDLRLTTPDDPERDNDLAKVYTDMGSLYRQMGRREEALAAFRQGRELSAQLAQREPEIWNRHTQLGYACYKLFDVERQPAFAEEAIQAYRRGLELHEKALGPNPSDDQRCALASTFSNLGDVEAAAGRRAEALRSYRESCRLYAHRVSLPGQTPAQKLPLARAWYRIGQMEDGLRHPEEAVQAFRQAAAVQRDVIAAAPEEPAQQRYLGVYLHDLGKLLMRSGQLREARVSLEEAAALREALHAAAGENVQYLLDLSATWVGLGQVREQLHDTEAALAAYRKAVQYQREVCTRGGDAVLNQKWLDERYQHLIRLLRSTGRLDEAAVAQREWKGL